MLNSTMELLRKKTCSKKLRFIKKQEGNSLLLGRNSSFGRIPSLGSILKKNKIKKIINKFLLAGDKFLPKMHLRQPRFTDSAWGPISRNKDRIQKFKEIGD